MFNDTFETFPSEIEAVEIGIAMFKLGHNTQRLHIVIKAALAGHGPSQRILARMAEWRVSQIMAQRQRFGQIFV